MSKNMAHYARFVSETQETQTYGCNLGNTSQAGIQIHRRRKHRLDSSTRWDPSNRRWRASGAWLGDYRVGNQIHVERCAGIVSPHK
jgi:hypothetical protein